MFIQLGNRPPGSTEKTMLRNFVPPAAAALFALSLATSASAYTVQQDGLGMDVSYSLTGQTANFRVEADFFDGSSDWIGTTMDSFSLQFGNAGNNNMIASFSGITDTDTSGVWTGYLDKVSGNGCVANTAEAICYTVNPTATGGDGATIIAQDEYFWEFSVTFLDGVDLDQILSGNHSIKFLSVKQNGNGQWSTGAQLSQEGAFLEQCTGPDCEPEPCQGPDCEPGTNVPAPASLALLGIGLLGLGALRRRS